MKKPTSTSRSLFTLLLAAAFVLPTSAMAQVKVIDVMYDPPGSDAGREWIKLVNTGSDATNIAGYRLAEGGTNHKLTLAQGTSTIAAGAAAIITTDPLQYESDHPTFLGAIFKSSFSLSNTGETIEIKDAKLNVLDTYSYTAPPVVKAAAAPKSSKTTSKSKTTFPYGNDTSAAALALAPTAPAVSKVWLYGLGALAIIIAVAAGALYMWPQNKLVTLTSGGEFNIE